MALSLRFRAAALVLLLAARAGADSPPPPPGSVRLPLRDYVELLDAAQPAPSPAPAPGAPLPAGFSAARFELVADLEGARLETTLDAFAVGDGRQELPLPDLGPLYEVEVLAGRAAVAWDRSGPRAVLRLPGRGTARVRLRSAPARRAAGDRVSLGWATPSVPAAQLLATLPPGHGDVALEGGSARVESGRDAVRVTASLEPGRAVELSYAVAAPPAPEEELLATAREARLYLLGDETLTVAVHLRVDVLRGRLGEVVLLTSPDLEAVGADASGTTVTAIERVSADPRRLRVALAPVAAGEVALIVRLERPWEPRTGVLELPEVELPGLALGESVAAVASRRPLLLDDAAGTQRGWERVDARDLPAELRALAAGPVLWAGRRTGTEAPALSLGVQVFDEAEGLAAVVHEARLLTLWSRDGRRVDRLALQLSTREPLLRLPLGEGAEVWSAAGDGRPLRPLTAGSDLLLPLGRGGSGGDRAVEIVLAGPAGAGLPRKGRASVLPPRLPFPVTHAEWSLVLPDDREARVRPDVWAEPGTPTVVPEGKVAGIRSSEIDVLTMAPGAEGGVVEGVAGGAGGDQPFGGRLRVRVVDAQGGPLPGTTVEVLRPDTKQAWVRTTDAGGWCLIHALLPGRYRVTARLQGFAESASEVIVTPQAELLTTVVLRSSARSEVTVTAERPPARRRKDEAPAAEPPPPPAPRQLLTEEERQALQRSSEAGIASIPIELPDEGRKIVLDAYLLAPGAETPVELEVRPAKRRGRR